MTLLQLVFLVTKKKYIIFLEYVGGVININKIEMRELDGIKGGFSVPIAVAVVSAFLFITQIIEGFVYPRGCSNE